jgi:tRNA-dihydrouridine synthase
MLNSRKIPFEKIGLTSETLKDPNEKILCPQILGNEEGYIRDSIQALTDWGAQAIDINMGCPVQKALRHNYGVALMGDANYAAEVTHFAVKHARVPVSVKLRAGLTKDPDQLLNFARGLENAGASWLTLHPRTADQQRRGQADWEQVRLLKTQLRIPIIGNGDVQTASDVDRVKATSGCDLVMIGRALLARPWLVWQYAEKHHLPKPAWTEHLRAPSTPEEEGEEYGRFLILLAKDCTELFGNDLGLRKLRFAIRVGSPWLAFGQEVVGLSDRAKNFDDFKSRAEVFFSSPQPMTQQTELRQ